MQGCSVYFNADENKRLRKAEIVNLLAMSSMAWDHLGEIANVAQLTGFDAVRLIGMIVNAATTARLHKKNCRQFAMHLRLIGNLLEQLKISELKKYPETREPLEQLEDALRRSYILVNSCQDRSYLYLLAMGWTIVYQFKKAQDEIDRYLKIIPLISLVDNSRVRERLEYIGMDQHEYTLDDEDRKVQHALMNPDPSNANAAALRKSLSYSYPNLPFNEVIKKENEKLHMELQYSQSYLDVGECELIQHLMEVAEIFESNYQYETYVPHYPYVSCNKEHEDNIDLHKNACSASRSISVSSSRQDLLSSRRSHQPEEWHSGLLGCCSEPMMLENCLLSLWNALENCYRGDKHADEYDSIIFNSNWHIRIILFIPSDGGVMIFCSIFAVVVVPLFKSCGKLRRKEIMVLICQAEALLPSSTWTLKVILEQIKIMALFPFQQPICGLLYLNSRVLDKLDLLWWFDDA
ncbi:hypothetical protein Tco_0138889 [Tanacetum coccineum]